MTLINHWPMQEDSGNAQDYTPGPQDMSVNGVTQGATGPLGATSYSFDGTDDRGEVSSYEVAFNDVTQYSSAMWVHPDNLGSISAEEVFLRWKLDSNNNFTLSITGSGEWAFGWSNSNVVAAAEQSSPQWVHMAATVTSDSVLHGYINGEEVGTATGLGTVTGTAPLNFGNSDINTKYFDGRMADARIYDHALTPGEVSYLYETSLGGSVYTDTKTHGSSIQPDVRVDVTLSSQSATVYVIGSPGTGSEEVRSASLNDGSNDYTLNWNSGHTDFDVQVVTDLTSKTSRVVVNRVALLA